jgi:hypothetical protein
MSFSLTGTIREIQPEQQVSASFRKRTVIVEHAENPNYPQLLPFECTQQRCELLDDFAEGERVEVAFNLKGREWLSPKGEKKYFLTLDVWRISRAGSAPNKENGKTTGQPTDTDLASYDAEDLPF